MIFQLTTKNCGISDASYKYIKVHLDKITRFLPHVEGDLIVFRLNIKRNIDLYHPPRMHPQGHKGYINKKPASVIFEGSMTFRLNKNKFYAHFKGQTIDECLDLGFNRTFKELEKYKATHFPAESEYPDRSTIRGDNSLV